ncbi:hypothetical protein Tco_1238112 [Tanacetum coccineum]
MLRNPWKIVILALISEVPSRGVGDIETTQADDDLMFDSGVLDDVEMPVEAKVDGKEEQSTKPDDSTAGEAEQREFRVPQDTQPLSSKDKGKGIMIEPEVPLKRKDQIALDEQIARDIQAKLDAELIEEQKLARKQEEEANIALIESWENTQAMIEADRLLAERLQSKEREDLTDGEKAKLFMEHDWRKEENILLHSEHKKRETDLLPKHKRELKCLLILSTWKEKGREETTKGSRKKMLRKKRVGKEQQQESSKKQKVEKEKESDKVDEYDEAELKKLLGCLFKTI